MKFELSEGDFELLLMALGAATGMALESNKPLGYAFVRLANTINKDNPLFQPYEIPQDLGYELPKEYRALIKLAWRVRYKQ